MFTVTVDNDIKLCLVHPSFAPRYVELAQENHDYLSQWLSWPYFCKTEAEFNAFIQHSLHNYADNKSMTCAVEYEGSIVGNMGFNTINHECRESGRSYPESCDLRITPTIDVERFTPIKGEHIDFN
ncbi:hypothetical protein L4D77_09495 [Photobacterium frigidiphilum]|uniref:hypothetical protein n=1 Tax=Photobacterium frigidiphilum TaxID=264736 RepID=UPI003D10974C